MPKRRRAVERTATIEALDLLTMSFALAAQLLCSSA
jgi:hypothetical protein